MSFDGLLRISPEGIRYLDISSVLGTPAGTILKNPDWLEDDLLAFVQRICSGSGSTKKVVVLKQVQGNRVLNAGADSGPGDGVFSDDPRHILVIRTADCFPIFLFDERIVGLLHAGWRGLLTGIVESFFKAASAFAPSRGRAFVGPGIGSCCFDVTGEVAILFPEERRQAMAKGFRLDLQGLILDELRRFGLEYVAASDLCTACQADLCYSYRRERSVTRQLLNYICVEG